MSKFFIGRPIEGVTLNGNEYVLDESGKAKEFASESEALSFLKAHGITEADMEAQGIVIEEAEACIIIKEAEA